MNRSEALDTAKSLVCDNRARQHGDFRKNYEATAILWTAYFEAQGIACPSFSCEDVLEMLSLMKLARSFYSENPDNYVDRIGYDALKAEAALGGEYKHHKEITE